MAPSGGTFDYVWLHLRRVRIAWLQLRIKLGARDGLEATLDGRYGYRSIYREKNTNPVMTNEASNMR